MSLSRLQNLLNAPRGTKFYVDVNALDATDSIENRGTSPTRPFRSIARALAEVARYSYQQGFNNDRFDKTSVIIAPGTYFVDNRPGAVVKNDGSLVLRNGGSTSINQWDLTSTFDISVADNDLYKLNSVHGGLIVPRGCSIIGEDLRKVKIVPLYVPNPENDNIEPGAIFRVTGASFFSGFSVFDSDPNGNCYKDYTTNLFVPNFSHHKLRAFEYADGVNPVVIDDEFQTVSTNFTDLQMYYDKIARVYGESSGRPIVDATYSGGITIDLQPVVDEYRIVGSRGLEVGITSIRSGDGNLNPSPIITVTLEDEIPDLSVDSPIEISGVGAAGYDGQYVVSNVISPTEIEYRVQNIPSNASPGVTGATLNLVVDTVTSASPYIFNVSLRSVYGMCGLLADGSRADGFRSMVVAQYTGIGVQKDDNAFVLYDSNIGEYRNSTTVTDLHTNSKARYKPEYESFHIKATNNAYLQLVSIFAVGYAEQFVTESGGDFSLNGSVSNFGARSLVSSGFRDEAFPRNDLGYITHVIPPQEIESEESSVEFLSIDVGITTLRSAGSATTTRLYLYNKTNENEPPENILSGYRIGARPNEVLRVQIKDSGSIVEFSSNVVIPNTETSYEKSFDVAKTSLNENNIVNSVITLTSPHTFQNGEKVRILSDDGHLPDELAENQVYHVITTEGNIGLGTTQIQLAQTLSGSALGENLSFNAKGGNLKVVSRVSDKSSGDIGHPIQWDSFGNWYITVSESNNNIYNKILSSGVAGLGGATSRTYIQRRADSRNLLDTVYRLRYVLPKDSPVTARPPLDGFIIQESSTSNAFNEVDIQNYFSDSPVELTSSTELRNLKFISAISWSGGVATVTTELPHDVQVGNTIRLYNVLPDGYNGTHKVTEVSSPREFKFSLASNPGAFANDTTTRNANLPYLLKKRFTRTYQIYKSEEIKQYIPNEQDGVYYLTVVNCSNSPSVTPFIDEEFTQPIQYLYPQHNRDNPTSDPASSRSFAVPDIIGKVVVNDPESSITKETLEHVVQDLNIGFGVTAIVSNSVGTAHTIFTETNHNLSGITSVRILSGGSNYLSGTYYGTNVVGFAGSTTGADASFKIVVNDLGSGIGTVTQVQVMHGGGAYGIGNTLNLVPAAGIGTTTGFVPAVVQVTSVVNGINQVISLSESGSYDNLYRVTGITNSKELRVSSSAISGASITRRTLDARATRTGNALSISTFEYDSVSGIATIGFSTSHGLYVNNKILLSGFDSNFFNKDVIVKRENSVLSVSVNAGKGGVGEVTTGTRFAYLNGYTSNAGSVSANNENLSGRLIPEYGGVTSFLVSSASRTATTLVINDALSLGLKVGDYLQIAGEIFRIKNTVTSNTVTVFRAILGSSREFHQVGSVVRRINVKPIELRRNSIINASAHTFEYVGYGPGNYSTAFPERQDRILSSQEEFLAQSFKTDGGVVIYNGKNNDGDIYTGNKKINTSTGEEEIFDAPVPTITGESPFTGSSRFGYDLSSSSESRITRSLKVEGGPNHDIISEFAAPVVFNEKITSYKDIEGRTLFIQGNEEVSRRLSINFEKPDFVGNYGDIEFNSEPQKYGFAGWIYTTDNEWEPWGFVGGPGVGIATEGNYVGFATLINLVTDGIDLTVDYDALTGISTLTFDANPRVAITTGALGQNFVGLVTTINFIGPLVTVSGSPSAGIATVNITPVPIEGGLPGQPPNSLQFNDNGLFNGVPISYYDETSLLMHFGGYPNISNTLTITNDGRLGFSTYLPTSKVEIVADNERSIFIKSTSGTEIIRIENTINDSTPFVIDQNGNVGINTATAVGALDVVGNAAVTGSLRLYESDRSNYIGFRAGSIETNFDYTLPTTYGSSGQVLTNNGSGILSWQTFGGGNIVNAGIGITISYVGQNATISNSGVRRIIAGSNITISPVDGTGEVTINASGGAGGSGLYPFTTRGFSMVL